MKYCKFVETCYEYGNKLDNMDVLCGFSAGSARDNGGYRHFAMKFGCADGAYIKIDLNEKDPKAWLKVIKNEKVNGEFKQTRFSDEFHTDLDEMMNSVINHVALHGGFDKNLRKIRWI